MDLCEFEDSLVYKMSSGQPGQHSETKKQIIVEPKVETITAPRQETEANPISEWYHKTWKCTQMIHLSPEP